MRVRCQPTVRNTEVICFLLISLSCLVRCGLFVTVDDKVDRSFDPDYLEKFLDPDSEFFRNISFCPRAWHVKEMLAVLKLWDLPGEEHSVTTEDGYILTLYRITPKQINSTPVLLLHGFLASPELFLIRGEEDLPVLLRDAGFDVWLASYRGGHYGRQHVNQTVEDEEFWDFTFHEHGLFDVPAMIDYILGKTGMSRVSMIGHSMGNAATFSMLSLRPEYNEKLGLFVGLAPYAVARIELSKQRRSLLKLALKLLKHNKNTKPTDCYQRKKINPLVGVCWSLPRVCVTAIQYGMSSNSSSAQMDWKLVPVLAAYFPSGTSNKNLEHLLSIRHGNFNQFDYGPLENMKRYGSQSPPKYDLDRVRVPVSLYYGELDRLVSVKGMEAQIRALPNVIKTSVVPEYNHLDFLIAKNTKEALYNLIIEDLNQYDSL